MSLMDYRPFRWLCVPYTPNAEDRPFLERAEVRRDDDLTVTASVLDNREAERFFGAPLARRGIQPVWLHIRNQGRQPFRLRLASIDPNYYPPLEAAYANHFRVGRRVLEFGLLACLFIHLLILLPFKVLGARSANRRMDAYFQEHGIGWGLIPPGGELAGFVCTTLDEGTKQFTVRLLGAAGGREFTFSIPVPGLRVDYGSKRIDERYAAAELVECSEAELRRRLETLPPTTTNRPGTRAGDPLNLVVVGDFRAIISGFGARWDETETISLRSCLRTVRAFTLGSSYRYSPVSPLYVEEIGRAHV